MGGNSRSSSVYLDWSYEEDNEANGSLLLTGIMSAEVLASLVPVLAEKRLCEAIEEFGCATHQPIHYI